MAKIKYHSAEAVKELRKLINEFIDLKKVTKSAGDSSAKSLGKIEGKLTSLQMLNGKTTASINRLSESVKKQTKIQSDNSKALEYQLKLGNTYNKQVAESTSINKRNTRSVKKQKSAFSSLFKTFGVFIGLNFLKNLGKDIFNMAKDFDSLTFAMKTVSDTAFDLASSQRFLIKTSEDYGVEILATSQRYVKFLAAAKQSNLSMFDTEKIFRSTTKAASVLGLKTDELTGVYLALEQMLSKGKVTTEELRRQLGERLPGAMGIMAAALDVTIPKLDEMLKKGEVLSAVALPKFAEALELAYGIGAVKKVDTLISAQNRLANTWQLWIQDIAKGDGVLSIFIKNTLTGLNKVVKALGLITGSEALLLQNAIIEADREFSSKLEKQVEARLTKEGKTLVDRTSEIYELRSKIILSKTKEEKAIHEQSLSDLLKLELAESKLILATKKTIAAEGISLAVDNFKALTKLREEDLAERKRLEEALHKNNDIFMNVDGAQEALLKEKGGYKKLEAVKKAFYEKTYQKEIVEQNKNVNQSAADLAEWTAKYDIYRKLLQESNVTTLPDKDITGKSKIDTSDIDLKIEKVKNSIKNLNHFLTLPTTEIQDRLDSIDTMLNLENQLFVLQYNKEIKLARENKNLKELASVKHYQKELDIKRKWDDKKTKFEQDFFKKGISDIAAAEQDKTNLLIIELTARYDEIINKTKEEEDRFKKELAEIRREGANASLASQAAFLKLWLDALGIHGEERVKIEQKINALLAKVRAKGAEDAKSTWQNDLIQIGEFVKEVLSVADALLERRIENINAEIEAEESKYDKLIALAGDDASKKEALEQQREDKIRILEAKRLKEEQKQAKFRKAAALSEIAINTAIAVSKVWGQTGIFGIAAEIPVLIMGALQAAAVLAAPIPQYKDGIDSVPDDQIAMINDGGKKEYVERDGQILSTNTRNAIVGLKKNDTVYKNYNEMASKSSVHSIIANGEVLKQNEFDKLHDTIESSISKGFSKAKVNINNIVKNEGNPYLKQKARF
jgi:tape measure domain-containing protein